MRETGDRAAAPPSRPAHGLLRRWAEAIGFVAIWVALGLALELRTNAYLLLGVPLTIAFQRLVRGESLRTMWVREAPPMGRRWVLPATAFAVLPLGLLVAAIRYRQWVIAGWMLAAAAGAVGAGYALMNLRRSALRPFVLCQLTAGVMGIGLSIVARAAAEVDLPPDPWKGLHDFVLYFPVCFALEEVSFRGVLDSHLYRPGQRFGMASALLGSVLWGLWHWPTFPAEARGPEVAIGLVIVHALIGVPLAIAWRRSGNLAVPAFTHAMLDGVRNALRVM